MELKEYPPRFFCEVADLTPGKNFFAVPKVLQYTLTVNGEDFPKEILIPSLTG